MGRSSNNNGNNNSSESGLVSVSSSSSSSVYLPNFPGVSMATSNHHHGYHPNLHYSLPPSPPPPMIHPNQYINMGHFYEGGNNGGVGGNGGNSPPMNVTPPARVYSPLSNGSNSSGGGSSSALSYVSSGSGGGGNGGIVGGNGGALAIMEAMNPVLAGISQEIKSEYEDFPREPDGGPVKITTWKDHVAVFNMDQVGVMCDVLLQEGDIPRLVDLLQTLAKDFSGRSEKILRAQAHVAFHAALDDPRKFPQVYKILETNAFSPQYHAGLQKLWFNAHYKEAEITRGRPLGAVDKYRIRRKFALPRTIWDGEETVYCFKERSRNSLRQSFALEKYPNLEEKKKLSKETGLTMTQVGNWFKNKRQREKEKMQGKLCKNRPKSGYNTPSALAAAMTPDLLGMMLNPNSVVNPSHPLQHHLHPLQHHHSHHQSHIAPLSPEDLENAIRKARYEEARLKNYIDENMPYSQPSQVAPPNSSNPLSPSNLQSYLHHQQPRHPNSQQMALGKSDITIGIVSSPGSQGQGQGPSNNNTQESNPPRANGGNGGGGGLTITAIPSPNDATSTSSPQQNDQSVGGNSSPQNNGGDLYGGASRPRSTSSNPSPSTRCGAGPGLGGMDLVPYHHHLQHHPHHPQHNAYHHGHGGHHHLHHHGGYDTGGGGGGNGLGPLVHPGAAAALSHA